MILEEKDATSDKLYSMALGLKNDLQLRNNLSENAVKMAKLGAAEVIYNNVYESIKNK